jgi:hypothetical protein
VTRDFLLGAIELGTALDGELIGTSLDTPASHAAIQDSLAHLQTLMDDVDSVSMRRSAELHARHARRSEPPRSPPRTSARWTARSSRCCSRNPESGCELLEHGRRSCRRSTHRQPDAAAPTRSRTTNDQLNGLSTTSSRPSVLRLGRWLWRAGVQHFVRRRRRCCRNRRRHSCAGRRARDRVIAPAAAVLYVTIAGSGGMIAVGGALGQTSEEARALVKEGVAQIESAIQGPSRRACCRCG